MCPRRMTVGKLTSDAGKILQDANSIESYSIEEKGFVVCMVSKVRATVRHTMQPLIAL